LHKNRMEICFRAHKERPFICIETPNSCASLCAHSCRDETLVMFKALFFGVVFVIVAGSVGWYLAEGQPPRPNVYKSSPIERGNLDISVSASGALMPFQSVLVGSQISGVIKEVRKRANDPVKRGEILALFDTNLLDAELRVAQIRLAQSQAALNGLSVEDKNLELREQRLTSLRQRRRISADRCKASLELALKNRERFQQMVSAAAISHAELEIKVLEELNAERDYKLAEIDAADVDADARQIVIDRLQHQSKQQQAVAEVMQAQAAVERAQTNLAHATIVSPMDGVVLEQWIDTGQTVSASFQSPNLFRIASGLEHMLAAARVDEADIGKIQNGMTVSFDVDAYPGEHFPGKVLKIALQPEAKANLVTYLALIDVLNPADNEHPHGKLLPGMTVNLKLFLERRTDVLRIPAAALRFSPGKTDASSDSGTANLTDSGKDAAIGASATVFTLRRGQLQPHQVMLGDNDGEFFELTGGDLHDGDRVITGQTGEGIKLETDLE
jgi:HlyD family secretion protein